jgi:hypothetical protein
VASDIHKQKVQDEKTSCQDDAANALYFLRQESIYAHGEKNKRKRVERNHHLKHRVPEQQA